jgi:hypothetical protein
MHQGTLIFFINNFADPLFKNHDSLWLRCSSPRDFCHLGVNGRADWVFPPSCPFFTMSWIGSTKHRMSEKPPKSLAELWAGCRNSLFSLSYHVNFLLNWRDDSTDHLVFKCSGSIRIRWIWVVLFINGHWIKSDVGGRFSHSAINKLFHRY